MALLPGILEDISDQDVFAVFNRINGFANQRHQRCNYATDLFPVRFFVPSPAFARYAERIEDAYRQSRIRAGRVDAKLRCIFKGLDALWNDAPTGKAIA